MRALVTGASRGIGAALLVEGRSRGHEVLGTIRRGDGTVLDVTCADAQARAAKEVGPLDLLVCNAGVYLDRGKDLMSLTHDDLRDTFAANVTGVVLTVQAQLRNLHAGGRIAIIASQMGSSARAGGNAFAYRASKAAVANLGANLALALQGHGIAVGTYHPGWVRTDMGGSAANLSADRAAGDLWDRFEALDLARSGCFESHDGQTIPY
ncbi:SDR family NAD(P)-dependent oxidoreductase [Jannaschia sp. S6380]|uniref:SDR family NAD(P)-dependent oxidoreductase n=1 Tax=Jannaschia sp. S6380 TaxID=2926408 RepID=UPI001FF5F3EB|nr:SDR family NAD(P)-dependent oxidoreductase [Jannaschia sp. S6380]MCK0166296.1 SDR family NAD(P)-dependent oxidoreductase [Jannaschia sp. S6380]